MSGVRRSLAMPSSLEACAAIGDAFVVTDRTGAMQQLVLEEVRAARPRASSQAWRMPYSMFMRGAPGGRLPQGLYWVSHPDFGRMCLFLVPRHRDRRGDVIRYEAVFD